GRGAGHEEHVADVQRRDLAVTIAPAHALEALFALERYDLGAAAQGDVGRLLDAPDEVARHAGGEAVAADHDVDVLDRRREVDRRLARRVAAADDDDLRVLAELRLDMRRAVVDAGPLVAVE